VDRRPIAVPPTVTTGRPHTRVPCRFPMAILPNERYLVRRDGKDYGPYDGATLSRYLAEGSIDGDDLVRTESGTAWSTIAELTDGEPRATGLPPVPGRPIAPPVNPMPVAPGLPPVSYVGGVLVTIFCCQVTGAIALVYAGLANTAAARGDVSGYASNKSQATVWLWVSVAAGLILCIGYAFLQFTMAAALRGAGP
jgi:hypothetical protein